MVRAAVELASGEVGEPIGGSSEPLIEITGVDPGPLGGSAPGGSGGDSSGTSASGTEPKRRGRKPGSKNGSGSGNAKGRVDKGSVETLSRLLLLVHTGLAAVTKTPELNLEKGEADLLAGPTADILAELNLTPDPRLEKAIAMITVCGIVYGPRAYNIRKRWEQENRERRARNIGSGRAGHPPAPNVAQPVPTASQEPAAPAGSGEQPFIPPEYNPFLHATEEVAASI